MNNQTQTLEHRTVVTTTRNTFKNDVVDTHQDQMNTIDQRYDLIVKGIGRAIGIAVYGTLAVIIFSVLFFIAFTIARGVYLELI